MSLKIVSFPKAKVLSCGDGDKEHRKRRVRVKDVENGQTVSSDYRGKS